MIPTITQNVTPRYKRGSVSWPKKVNFSQRGSVNPTTTALILGIIVIFSVAWLSFFYLNQVQGTAAQDTDIQALEERLQQLRERQRALELEGARLRSLQAIEERAQKLNLVTTDQFAYLPEEPIPLVTLAE